MRLRILSALLMSMLSFAAYADITIDNNTDATGSGRVNFSPCSSVVPGGRGVILPRQQGFSIPSFVLRMFCGNSDCQAYIYATNDCSGDVVGTATVNADKGVISKQNYDKKEYKVTGSGNKLTIEYRKKTEGLMGWFKSFI